MIRLLDQRQQLIASVWHQAEVVGFDHEICAKKKKDQRKSQV
jgi:hypothetical protein